MTHPGVAYAALLVGPDFRPPLTADVLPTEGVIASAVTEGTPPFWRRWWFLSACALVCLASVFALHRFRLNQMADRLNVRFEERLAERMRVAQILHDTLLQGVISTSMQLHIAVDQLPADSPAFVPLRRVLKSMGLVVEEGRTTLRGLRSTESVHDLERALSEIPQELGLQGDVSFCVTVKGRPLPLQPSVRVGFYSIGRDALLNAFRQPRAREVKVELRYRPNEFRLLIRHDGRKSGSEVLHSIPRDVQQLAERIGARLKVRNRITGGTQIDLRVPAKVAFESHSSRREIGWLDRLHQRGEHPAEPDGKT
ncbi:MAG TPA: histidine kinase [Bryobacteraceae bacterium]|nr:histidine kinase [Bryobacteraceae bacterium]